MRNSPALAQLSEPLAALSCAPALWLPRRPSPGTLWVQSTGPAGLTLSLLRAAFSPREMPRSSSRSLRRGPSAAAWGWGEPRHSPAEGQGRPPPPLHPPTGAFGPSSLRGVWTFLPPASGQTWNVLKGPQNDSGWGAAHRSSGAAERTSPPGISSSVGGDPLLSPCSGGTWDPRTLPHQGMREPARGGRGTPAECGRQTHWPPNSTSTSLRGPGSPPRSQPWGEAQTSCVVPVKFRVRAGSLLASWSPIQDSPAFSLAPHTPPGAPLGNVLAGLPWNCS